MFVEKLPSKNSFLVDLNANGYVAGDGDTPADTKLINLAMFKLTADGADGFIENSGATVIPTFINGLMDVFGVTGTVNKFTTEWSVE